MSSIEFNDFYPGTDLETVFAEARASAFDEAQRGRGRPPILTKGTVVLVSKAPMIRTEAEAYASQEMANLDPDWPALALAVRADDAPTVIGYLIYSIARC